MTTMTIKKLAAYLIEQQLEYVAIEPVDRNVPGYNVKYGERKPYVLPNRLIVSAVYSDYGSDYGCIIKYVAGSSFKQAQAYIPNDFEVIVLDGEDGKELINKYEAHINGLEKDFQAVYDAHSPELNTKLKQLEVLFNEIEDICNTSGIPIQFSRDTFYIRFTPASLHTKFGNSEMIRDIIGDISEVYPDADDGWRHSSVC